MKKSVKLKKIGLSAATLLLCLAVMITCIAFSFPIGHAFAADPATPTALVSGIRIAETCDYGETFDVPAADGVDVSVIAPNGKTVTVTDNKVTANQVGNYTVKYSKGDAEYSFKVYVTLGEELILKVKDNGAAIPTTIKKGDNSKFTLPAAQVAYYDDNKILQTYDDAEVSVTVSGPGAPDGALKPGDEVTVSKAGKLFVTYYARVGADGSKYFYETYEVNVQETFEDTSAPTLTVNGVSNTASVNRPVSLPKATATDSDDKNVQVKITVVNVSSGKDVLNVDVDDDGYAYIEEGKEYKPVEFDNDEVMTFYPTETGKYKVTYQATDDSGNLSSKREFTIDVSDRVAPVFKNIDETVIPETWGLSVYNKDSASATVENSGKLTFYVPELVDNKDHVYDGKEGDTDLIDLYFRITDSDNNKIIVEFNDIIGKDDAGRKNKTGSDVYGEKDVVYEWKDGEFTFDFNNYHKAGDGDDADKLPGAYTVYYRAGDKAGNHSSKTYTVNLVKEYTDDVAPTVAQLDVPEYVSAIDTFTVPAPAVTDASDTRVTVEYKIYSADENGVTVKGGEKASFVTDNDKIYLVLDGDEDNKLEVGGNLYFVVKATDDAGNVSYNYKADSSATVDYQKSNAVVTIIGGDAIANTYNGAIAFDGELEAGKKVSAGGFTVGINQADNRKYVGFEVIARDASDAYINVELTTYTIINDDGSATLYVDDITLLPITAGDCTLTVRVFDVNGYSTVNAYSFSVAEANVGQGGTQAAATVGTSGSVNVSYKLHNDVITGIGEKDKSYCVVRKISSSSAYALMGSEINFKSQGSARIQDGYAEIVGGSDVIGNFNSYGANDGKYTVSVTDTATPVIELQGAMPTYAALNQKVELPYITGYSENATAEIEVTVTDKSGKPVKVDQDDETKIFSFTGTTDGVYTITVTATTANSRYATLAKTISIGDVVGPEFKIIGGTATSDRKRIDETFEFGKVELTDPSNETASEIKVTKRLLDPSNAEVSGATVYGSYNTYNDDVNNGTEIKLTMVGDYYAEYTLEDKAGNKTTQRVKITVTSKGSGKPTTFTGLSIALTVIAVVLLVGVIVYVVRFRKVKSK